MFAQFYIAIWMLGNARSSGTMESKGSNHLWDVVLTLATIADLGTVGRSEIIEELPKANFILLSIRIQNRATMGLAFPLA